VSDAPIPMALSEALVIGEAILARLDGRERRAVEQLMRHARQARRSASSSVDITGELMRTRDILRAEADRLTEAISAATTIR
jgi:hypothetical protein